MTASDQMDFEALAGVVLADKYKVIEVVGTGAMGCVYRAEQVELGRSVALKLMISEEVTEHIELFRTEALAASRINHPHAISIYDFGVTKEEGIPYLVMEFLRGRVLADVIAEGPLRPSRVATIGAQVLSALAEAHACGVIHRDLKADNIILEPLRDGDDYAKLIDFGIARLAETDDRIEGIAGTPAYMPPEQIRGEAATVASDIYSIGALLYEMVIGEPPFGTSDDVMVILRRHLDEEPTAPKDIDSSCPQTLSDLILKALRKDQSQRWTSAGEMRDALVGAVKSAEAGRSCPSCAELVGPVARFCPGCGHKLDSGRRKRATVTPQFEDEPREQSGHIRAAKARVTRLITREFAGPPPSLVGRAAEFLRVAGFIKGEGSDGAALAVTGPRGIGKARLVLEAARSSGHEKPVFVAGADPSGLRSAWYPIISTIEALFELSGDVTAAELGAALEIYGLPDRDLPGLCELFGLPGTLSGLVDEVRLRELEAATLRVLVFAHRRWPGAVLCFNDVDRFDIPSASLLGSLIARLDGAGTRVVVTTADPAAPSGASVLELGPLSPADVHQLAALSAPSLDLPTEAELFATTGGVPESVDHYVRWIASGHSALRAQGLLVDLIAQRLSILLPAARRVLQSIAVHGTTCPRSMVETTHGSFDETAAQALRELIDERFVVEGDGILLLSSELVRDVVRLSTPMDVARDLHRNALKQRTDEPGTAKAVLAQHATGAFDVETAHTHCFAAAEDSRRRFDDNGASRWFARAAEVATELIAAGVDTENEHLIDATIELADVLRRLGNIDLAKDVLTQAVLGDPNAKQRAQVAQQRGRLSRAAGDTARAIRHYRKSIDVAVKGGVRTGNLLADSYQELAESLVAAGKPADAIVELKQAILLVSYSEGFSCPHDVPQLWRMGLLLAETRHTAGDRAGSEEVAMSAFAYARRIDSVAGMTRLAVLIAAIAVEAGDHSRAHEFRMRAIDAARKVGDRRTMAELLLAHAKISGDQKTADQGRALAREIGWHDA